MRSPGWAALLLAAGTGAFAGEPDVTVYVRSDCEVNLEVIVPALHLAAAMFDGTGVAVAWRRGAPPRRKLGQGLAITAVLVADGRNTFAAPALAEAFPYAGAARPITIYYDQLRAQARTKLQQSALLAHVLVHEITHVLQAIDRHSESGLMKARWTVEDIASMAERPLSFTSDDVDLIRAGLGRLRAVESGRVTRPEPVGTWWKAFVQLPPAR